MVKCADCGYLAVRNVNSHCLDEAGSDYRERGAVALGREHGRNQYHLHEAIPLCFDRRPYLGAKVKSINKQENIPDAVSRIINEEIKCKGFTEWQQGFTPKEHREMIDRKWERTWRIITGIIFVILAGLFTLLGVYIANFN